MNRTFFLLVLIFLVASVYCREGGSNYSQYLPKLVQLSTNTKWQNEFSCEFESLYTRSVVSCFSLGLLSSIIEDKSTFPQRPDQAACFMMKYLVQIDREQKKNPRFLAVKLKFDYQLTHLQSSDFSDFEMADWKAIALKAGIFIPEEKLDKSVSDKSDSFNNELFISDKKVKEDKVVKDKVKIDKIKEDKIKPKKVKEDKIKEDKIKEEKDKTK